MGASESNRIRSVRLILQPVGSRTQSCRQSDGVSIWETTGLAQELGEWSVTVWVPVCTSHRIATYRASPIHTAGRLRDPRELTSSSLTLSDFPDPIGFPLTDFLSGPSAGGPWIAHRGWGFCHPSRNRGITDNRVAQAAHASTRAQRKLDLPKTLAPITGCPV